MVRYASKENDFVTFVACRFCSSRLVPYWQYRHVTRIFVTFETFYFLIQYVTSDHVYMFFFNQTRLVFRDSYLNLV